MKSLYARRRVPERGAGVRVAARIPGKARLGHDAATLFGLLGGRPHAETVFGGRPNAETVFGRPDAETVLGVGLCVGLPSASERRRR